MLAVAPEDLGVSLFPVATARWAGLDGLVSLLVHASGLLAGGGLSTELTVLHLGAADPVDTWVSADGLVGRINHDNFKELETGILTNPVGVEDTEVGALAGNTLFGNGLVGALGLDLLDSTGVSRLTVDLSLGDVSLATTSADTDAVHNVALLGLVADLACLVGTGGTVALVDDRELTILPGADSEDKTAEI